MKIAYLINQYPKVSHAFIRREILALEADGVSVARTAIRQTKESLSDPADQRELSRTRVLLNAGAAALALATLRAFFTHPMRFFRALRAAMKLARPSERSLAIHLIYLAEACLLRKWMHSERVEHLHAHFGTNSTAVAYLCRLLGGPGYSFTVHGPEEFDNPRGLSLDSKISDARFAIAISEFGRSQLLRWAHPADWEKIQVVHCGIDEAFLDAPATVPPPAPRLVCVGRLCVEKGHAVLLQAVAQLVDRGIPLQLVLIGDGPLRAELEETVKALGLSENVQFRGWQSGAAIREELLNSRALVLPSFAEGLPVVLMESLALARPVITTQIAGIPELVKHGENGWLIPPGKADALAKAMEEALSAPVQRLHEMGAAGARRVREQHDAKTEAAKLAQLFHQYSPRPVSAVPDEAVEPGTAELPVGVRG